MTDQSRPSLILALHERFEQSFIEYNYVDRAKLKLTDDGEERLLGYRFQEAMQVMTEEGINLQRTILFQVPTTDEELTVLAYHVWNMFDPDADDGQCREDRQAVGVGLDNLFDYLVGEGRADMQETGRMFTTGAMLAFERRRFRHAKLEPCEA